MKTISVFVFGALTLFWPQVSGAQTTTARFEVGVQLSSAMSSQFDDSDHGIGGRLAWRPGNWIGLESELVLYPSDFPDQVAFSRRRIEGLFGATFGPTLGRARPFVKLRSGFLKVQEAPKPFACIAIFPPPLACQLGAGDTLPAFDLGGGLEWFATKRTFVRIDAGDQILKYPGPVFDADRNVRDEGFFSHNLRFAVGAGLRF